jgi:cyclin-dependent kinase-like
MWALGCLIGEMSDGQPLFPGDSEIDTLYLIQKILGPLTKDQKDSFNKNKSFSGLKFPGNLQQAETLSKKYSKILSPLAISLMEGLLKLDPRERLTADQALKHQYFFDMNN